MRHFLIFCLILIHADCEGKDLQKECIRLKSRDSIPKDIPHYKDGSPSLGYVFTKKCEVLLELQDIEDGHSTKEIRLWYTFSITDTAQLVVLRNNNGRWSAELFTFSLKLHFNYDSIKLLSKHVKSMQPKSGWDNFIKKINSYKVDVLPDQSALPDYSPHADGDGVIVEIGTAKRYRIYSYQLPNIQKSTRQEIKNIENIIELVSKEFRFQPLHPLIDRS